LLQYSMKWNGYISNAAFPPTSKAIVSGPLFVVRRSPSSRITVRHRGEASIRHCAIPTAFPQHSYSPYVLTFPCSVSFLTSTEVFFLSLRLRLHMLAAISRSAGLVLILHVVQILLSSRYLISICLWRHLLPRSSPTISSGTPEPTPSSFLVGPPHHLCCQEIRKALEPTCVLHVLELGQSWLTAAANLHLHLHLRLDSLYLRLPASRR
jgi:hypothetical protein